MRPPASTAKDPPERGGDAPERGGLRRAAILMVALDAETGSKVFQSISEADMERLSREIASLGIVEKDEMLSVLEEFKDSAMLNRMLREGGYENAIQLIRKSLPEEKAARLVRLLEAQRQSMPFQFLEHTEAEGLAALLEEEHPQTIALVLSHLAPAKAAEVLTRLPSDRQVDIVRRIATLGHTSPEAVQRVESGLRKHLASREFGGTEETGGANVASEILGALGRSAERAILETIEEESAELADEIRKLLFAFEDLVLLEDRSLRRVLEEVDSRTLAFALGLSSEDVRGEILESLSERAAELTRAEIRSMGPVRISEVEAAQSRVVEVVRRLESAGEVVVRGRGEGSPLVR